MSLFHCTIDNAINPIMREGIDPLHSQSSKRVVWLCQLGKVANTIKHVAKVHGWNPMHVQVIAVNATFETFYPSRWQGTFISRSVVPRDLLRVVPSEWVDLLFRKPTLSKAYFRTL